MNNNYEKELHVFRKELIKEERGHIRVREIRRGQVLIVDVPSIEGCSVQHGIRPYVVVSNEKANAFSPTILVVPLTTQRKKHMPTHVYTSVLQKNGRRYKSTIMCEQILTVDKKQVIECVDKIDEHGMVEVDKALKISLGLNF